MAKSTEESMGESISSSSGGDLSQPPQPGLQKATVDCKCPICLRDMKKPAYVAYCMHQFCFRCIQRWVRAREDCPICRQPLEQVLHSVRGDDDYEVYVVGLPAHLHRRMATERARCRSPQRRYNLRRRLNTNQSLAVRSEPTGTESSQRQGGSAEPSNASSQLAPAPSASLEPALPRAGERTFGPDAPPDPHSSRV